MYRLIVSHLLSGLFALTFITTALHAQEADSYVNVPFNLSLINKISLGHALAKGKEQKIYNCGIALGLISTKADKLRGVDISLGVSGYEESVRGVQLGGLVAGAGNKGTGLQIGGLISGCGNQFTGLQVGGLINGAGNNVNGLQLAGLINGAGQSFTGAQFAGLINGAGNNVNGLQLAGLINGAGQSFTGAQFAGIINGTGHSASGLQVAGILNAVGQEFRGVQVAGLLNAVGRNFSGIQISGFRNAATNVAQGVQIGLYNTSETNSGVPLGLVSKVESVGFAYDLFGDETRFVNIGLRSGTAVFYNLLSVGLRPGDPFSWSVGWGFGRNFKLAVGNQLDLGISVAHINEGEFFTSRTNLLSKLQVMFIKKRAENLSLFAGPTLNLLLSRTGDGSWLAPWSISDSKSGNLWKRVWPGVTAGVRF